MDGTWAIEKKAYFFPATIVLLFLLFTFWSYHEYQRSLQVLDQRMEERARDVSLALYGMVNAQREDNSYIAKEKLDALLSALVESNPLVHSIELYSIDGSLLSKGLSKRESEEKTRRKPFVFPGPSLGLGRPIVLDKAELALVKSGAVPEISLARASLHMAILALDDRFLEESLLSLKRRKLLAVVLALFASAALILAWQSFRRSARLALSLVKVQEENKHLQKMRLAAAGLAHETKNPLNAVRSMTQSLDAKEQDHREVEEQRAAIIEEVDRINARLADFLDYSKPKKAKLAEVEVKKCVEKLFKLIEAEAEDEGIRLRAKIGEERILADGELLRQAIFNLLLNALAASPAGAEISVSLSPNKEGRYSLEVEDQGEGVAEEEEDEIFMPYFTSKEGGSGLGLAVVQQIASAHDWELQYEKAQSGGALFRLKGIERP